MAASRQTVGRSTKTRLAFVSPARASSHHIFKKRDETPAICFGDCNQAFTIAQSVGKTAGLCKEGSSFQRFYAICRQCIADNTEDTQKAEQDYVEPQFQQFVKYCDEQSTSLTSIALTGTIWVTLTTPTPCEACIVTTALDYKSRPIVYTLGTQPATEVLKYFPSPVETSSSTPNASGPDIAVIIGPVIPSVVLLLLLGFLFFRWFKRRGLKKAEQGHVTNEEEPREDKPQLHSDCIACPTFELEGSALTVPEGNNVSMKEESEMPANEPAAHEMSADKKIARKSVRIRVESFPEES